MNSLLRPDPESCSLLLAIARPKLDADAIRSGAEKIEDWERFLRLTQAHRMAPMAFRGLENAAAQVPQAILQRLAAEYERNLCQSVLNASELLKVLDAFGRAQIRAIPFKGIVLAASVYKEPGVRACGDLDLLIRHQDLERATAILLERGFQRLATDPQFTPATPECTNENHEEILVRGRDNAIIELRWKLDFVFGRYARGLNLEWAWADRHSVRVTGTDVPDMSPERKLLTLCMHGSRHVWSRLLWICDIAHLVLSATALDWESVAQEARALGLWRPLALGVLLANRMLGTPTDCPLLFSIQQDNTVLKLTKHFEENLLVAPGMGPAGRIPYNVLLLDSRERLRLLFSSSLLRPNELDRAAIPFAGPQPLYYLVRPIRLLLDRSSR